MKTQHYIHSAHHSVLQQNAVHDRRKFNGRLRRSVGYFELALAVYALAWSSRHDVTVYIFVDTIISHVAAFGGQRSA